MMGLRRVMGGSINPSDWLRMEGAGTVDFEEFVALAGVSAVRM